MAAQKKKKKWEERAGQGTRDSLHMVTRNGRTNLSRKLKQGAEGG